ncbi:MAG: 2OG-Fe(II) oxygenase [Leucobacter sp.]
MPRDKLRQLLGESEIPTSHSASVQLNAKSLDLRVESIGPIPLPIQSTSVKQLIAAARPAHVGKGEETLHDTSVRDTWELTPEQVKLRGEIWETELAAALEQLGIQLGLSRTARLRAELHSMLVYGKGQFFAPHQDSEKHDDMIATLVVSLPSAHSGGELVIDDGGVLKQYLGSRDNLTLVAFFADRRHEVLPVRSGHRVTLTFNILVEAAREPRFAGPTEEATALLREHFSTRSGTHHGRELVSPQRFALLLDHEYSRHGLDLTRLKGVDADRVALLTAAASNAGCECALALVEIRETWDAAHSGGYRYDDFYDDDFDGTYDDDLELNELIEDSAVLTWWTDSEAPGEISLALGEYEVCAVTPTVSLRPLGSEYEGYMGNYGNTIDRWYRRAALVLWRTEHALATRALAAPEWALDAIRSLLVAGEQQEARAKTTTLIPLWHDPPATALPTALEVAYGVQDATTATGLLQLFRLEMLSSADGGALANLAREYPKSWWNELLTAWSQPHYGRGRNRKEWIEASLVPLCESLHAAGAPEVAEHLIDRIRQWFTDTVRSLNDVPNDELRAKHLVGVGPAAAAILSAANDRQVTALTNDLRELGEVSLPLLMSMLRVYQASDSSPVARAARFADVANIAQQHLTEVLTRSKREPNDWSISWTSTGGDDADRLASFLGSPEDKVLEWQLAQRRRKEIHHAIDTAALPVTHRTQRTGSPYTLVLTKTKELFDRETEKRTQAKRDLAWILRMFD